MSLWRRRFLERKGPGKVTDHPKETQFLNTSTLHNQKPSVPEVKLHSPILEKSLKPGISGSAMPLCSNPHAHVERQEGNFPQAPDGKEHRD